MGGRARQIIDLGWHITTFAKLVSVVVAVEGRHVAEEHFTLGRRMSPFAAWRFGGGSLDSAGV